MHVVPETPQSTVTEVVGDGSQAQKNRRFFHLALLITTALLTTTLWVSNTQTPAHADTQADNDLQATAPTAPYCPPGSGGPSGSGDGNDEEYDPDDVENPMYGFPEEGPGGPNGGPDPLSDNDRRAIWGYTTTKYGRINGALENNDLAAIRRQSGEINAINAALRKLPDHRGTVYRTTNVSLELLRSYRPGETITMRPFMSTTKNINMDHFGPIKFVIQSKTGKDISKYSRAYYEDEVLFGSGTRFKITAKYKNDQGRLIIEMFEVP